jgi:hypothetical protein
MKPIYVGDLFPSIASYKKIIEKYDKGKKKGNLMKKLSEEMLTTLIGKYDYYKKLLPC